MSIMQHCVNSMMGMLGLGGPTKSAGLLEAERRIPTQALRALQDAYAKATQSSGILSKADFQVLLGNADPALQPLTDGLWAAVRAQPGGPAPAAAGTAAASGGAAGVTLEQLTIAKWRCLHDGDEAGVAFAFQMLQPDAQGHVSWEALSAVAAACLQLASGQAPAEDCVQSLVLGAQRLADAEEGLEKHLNRQGFLTWAKQLPAVATVMRSLLAFGAPAAASSGAGSPVAGSGHSCSNGTAVHGSRGASSPTAHDSGGGAATESRLPPLPQLIRLDGISAASCLLQTEWAWAIATSGFLPPQRCRQWRLLFASGKHGQSFSTFMGRCSDKGATLVLVRDKGGAVFGGFASAPWQRHGNFYGSFANFLFSLKPALMVYRPSGVNQNFQFCGQNFTQVPNGLGFGGQIGYWGLYVDGKCEGGMSRECSTFKSPMLSTTPLFEVDAMECWQVDLPEPEDENASKGRGGRKTGSVLGQRREDKQLLELAGRTMQHAQR